MIRIEKFFRKIFGGLKLDWSRIVIFAIVMGIYTALMAMLAPDGSSFHDIAVTVEWWVLPAILIIANSKKPLDAALYTFVFFLISQPLVYLIQVPFNEMGWGLLKYYGYWFVITLLTFPGAYLGWFIKKEKWYAGLILSVMTVLLLVTGFGYISSFAESFPNHLLSAIYCFGIVPILIFGILKDKKAKIVASSISGATIIVSVAFMIIMRPFELYSNNFIKDNGIEFVGEPYISTFTGEARGDVEIIEAEGDYNFKFSGIVKKQYSFTVSDDESEYSFAYYYDTDAGKLIITRR